MRSALPPCPRGNRALGCDAPFRLGAEMVAAASHSPQWLLIKRRDRCALYHETLFERHGEPTSGRIDGGLDAVLLQVGLEHGYGS
jgi:hypothetical protein